MTTEIEFLSQFSEEFARTCLTRLRSLSDEDASRLYFEAHAPIERGNATVVDNLLMAVVEADTQRRLRISNEAHQATERNGGEFEAWLYVVRESEMRRDVLAPFPTGAS